MILVALISNILPFYGQDVAESLQIGYCCGEGGSMGDITSSSAKTLSAAIQIPSGMIESLVGNRVESIRVYMPSKLNVTSLTAWVRTTLDGENLSEVTVKGKELVKGWNELTLDEAFEIEDNSPFYIGYRFEQKSRAYVICCTGQYVEGGLYYRYDEGDWETDTKYGNLCIEGVVRGDNLPMYDLELNYVSVPPVYYIGDNLSVKLRVINHAIATVNGFTLTYSAPGVFSEDMHVDCHLKAGEFADLSLSLPPLKVLKNETLSIDFSISSIDGGEDEALGNNSRSVTVSTTDQEFKKVVLVEEFTTEQCGNCPTAAPKVYAAINRFNDEQPGSVAMICHHSGFYTDFLTSKFDETYLSLYGGTTYAPAAMVDRYAEFGVPVFGISTTDQIYEKISEAYSRPVAYSLEANALFDEETSRLTVNVNGSKVVEEDMTPTRISVVVVENDIPSRNQSGADGDYVHQHAMRTANSAWGEEIDWEGYDFSYSCSLEIKEEWVKDNLEVIVFINQYDEKDEGRCNVENTRFISFPAPSTVSVITDGKSEPVVMAQSGALVVSEPYEITGVWTVSGTKVSNRGLSPGLYIVEATANGVSTTKKVLVK